MTVPIGAGSTASVGYDATLFGVDKAVVRRYLDEWYRSLLITGRVASRMHELDAARERAGVGNWDGEGAAAVTPETAERARRFLELLPASAPEPSVTPETDGEIALEWYLSPTRVLTVAIGSHLQISYAGLFGSEAEAAYGYAFFLDELPPEFVNLLQRLYAIAGS